MSAHTSPAPAALTRRSSLKIVSDRPAFVTWIRAAFWITGLVLAAVQAWIYRYQTSADSISYLDMSDGVLPGGDWHRLINGVWSPLYPFLLGLFRAAFRISPGSEIAAAHFLNVIIFAAAFLCFEYLLSAIMRRNSWYQVLPEEQTSLQIPAWILTLLAYSLFLWTSVDAIGLEYLRPDMLLSCFIMVAAGMLLNMQGRPAEWSAYLKLGAVLGVGVLAKEAMLPLGILIVMLSLFTVKDWRPALRMAAVALAITVLIGAFYFVPLSRALGKPSLGRSGAYNYLVHVDRAGSGEGWYMENPGKGTGKFSHPPVEVWSSPPAYAFDYPATITHPLRFDPSYWMAGVRPRFAAKRQIGETLASLIDLSRSLRWLTGIALFVVALFMLGPRRQVLARVSDLWPIGAIGLAGCAMYLLIHVEARYIGTFLLLICCMLLGGLQGARLLKSRAVLPLFAIAVCISLVGPLGLRARQKYVQFGREPNLDAAAALALQDDGVAPGDHVGRISSIVTDLSLERIARVKVVAEVDYTRADQFWSAAPAVQNSILDQLASHGAKAVIATSPLLTDENRLRWKRLGNSRYWVWLPGAAT